MYLPFMLQEPYVKKNSRLECPRRFLPSLSDGENAWVKAGTKRIKRLRPRKLTITLKLMPTSTMDVSNLQFRVDGC